MTTNTKNTNDISLAKCVAHEDLKIGDFVAVLNEVIEFASFLWCNPIPNATDEPVRIRYCAADGGTPLKIKAICLPFVYVKSPAEGPQTIDVRQVQLVRLRKRYAKFVWKDVRKHRSKKRKRK